MVDVRRSSSGCVRAAEGAANRQRVADCTPDWQLGSLGRAGQGLPSKHGKEKHLNMLERLDESVGCHAVARSESNGGLCARAVSSKLSSLVLAAVVVASLTAAEIAPRGAGSTAFHVRGVRTELSGV